MHTPYLREQPSDTLVLFIHGFLGSPDQFSDLAEAAYGAGASVQTLLLPGHGGTARGFSRTTRADWYAHVRETLDSQSKKYANIILAAHSMGGLLALNASLVPEYNVRALFLHAVPMRLRIYSVYTARTFLRTTLVRSDEAWQTYAISSGVKNARLHPLSMLRPYRELRRLTRETAAILPRVTVPVTLVFSKRDETSAYAGAEILRAGLTRSPEVRLITLERALHAYVPPDERRVMVASLLRTIMNYKC